MSTNNKRCSSGTVPKSQPTSLDTVKQNLKFSRSKTCAFTGTASPKSKPDRLNPIVLNTTSQLNDQTLPDEVNGLPAAMVNTLSLHSRGIVTIPHLSEFSKLQVLDLSCNDIKRIENLRGLTSLRDLRLYGNKIERIENLEGLNQLEKLQLQYNEIQVIGNGLVPLTGLQMLRIDSNKLSQIRFDEILKLVQLNSLDISDCPISSIDFVNTLSSLCDLRACNCGLKALPNQFRNLRYLTDLDLSNNQLSQLAPLKSLPSLRNLRLANNSIQDLQILSSLVHLNEVDLSNNKIKSLPSTFDKLIDLQNLDISYNSIKSLKDLNVIHRMESLFIINVKGNPFVLETDSYTEKLLEICPKLEIIDDINVRSGKIETIEDESNADLSNIDDELRQVDEKLEKSIAVIQTQFDEILNDLRKLNVPINIRKTSESDNTDVSNNSDKKSKHRLFQALNFSEENYQDTN